MTTVDETKLYNKYALDVVEGRCVAGEMIRLAAQRYLSWFNRDDIYFNYEDVDRKIRFISRMRLREGGQFLLLPYQSWILAAIFGWYYVSDPTLRVVNNVLLLTARKNGKSVFAAALALVCALCDGERSPEVAFIANSARQAEMLFKYCNEFCTTLDPQHKLFRQLRHDIRIPQNGGQINVLSSDTTKLDGRNDSAFIQDEGHAARSTEIWNILQNGQVARHNPLAISISTAGYLIGSMYPLYSQWEYCCQVLRGQYEDDTWFAAIFQLDADDDWRDETVWIKANPSLGQTLTMKKLRSQIHQAIVTPANEVSIKTKNLNIWCQSSEVWIPNEVIRSSMQPIDLEDFKGQLAFMGVDLSSVADLSVSSVMLPPDAERKLWPDKFVFKNMIYVPQQTCEHGQNGELYRTWARNGYVHRTNGNVIDYDEILHAQLEVSNILDLFMIYYDQYNATQWAITAQDHGLVLQPFSQSIGNFNRATKQFELLMHTNKIVIDDNPCTEWCFGNVALKMDHNDNVKPVRAEGDKTRKIDPVIAMIQALGGWMSSQYYAPECFAV